MLTFQASILNASPSIALNGIGEEEMERRRLALQQALASCLSVDEMTHTVRLFEQEFSQKTSVNVSELCQRLFETMPQIQLDKEARLRLLRTMRQPKTLLAAENLMPPPKYSEPVASPEPVQFEESMQLPEPMELTEPMAPSEPIPLLTPEDSTSPELFLVTETPPVESSPEDSTSPELFVLRYSNFGKEILG
ncbi:MAG: hypothetical protein ETSY2_17545 [Candidatus Entotheonella gemina]|uniref:Uncharacterized protein n=1 Tax=Candidatus Entotheonella gemina TaxID=1429439 RepID=W4M845_9BACT|nr:MAG: hypothetical protein ETSY2_17545 [Candidatus Entotheonella gemina]